AQAGDEALQARLRDRLQIVIEQSGLGINTTHLLLMSMLAACGFGGGAGLLSHSIFISAVGASCAAIAPVLFVLQARERRRALLSRQLPEAFDTMGRAIRSGQTVTAAFQMVANEFPVPISEEFAICYEQQHLGIEYEVALRDLARRTGMV